MLLEEEPLQEQSADGMTGKVSVAPNCSALFCDFDRMFRHARPRRSQAVYARNA